MSEIPEWARRKASLLASQDENGSGSTFGWERAFARYIAEHEESPVDPLLIEARKLTERWWPEEGALEGKLDESEWTQRLLFALKRGIELAKSDA